MFRRLRTRLILINLAITTLVLVIAFATIYLIAQESARERRPHIVSIDMTQSTIQIINERVLAERQASLESLLASLITTGIVVEVAVAIASYCFAEMAIRPVRESYEAQKQFIANASHEIKTPLAAISANLEAANITENRWIDNVAHEVHVLTNLNQELLALAQLDGDTDHTATREKTPVQLQETLTELIATFAPQIEAKGIKVNLKITPTAAQVTVPQADFEQLATILLDNAIKYSKQKINIRYNNQKLVFENDGAKISATSLPHIFERFYQSDKSSNGVGLGLAIAKSLADRNGWSLTAESKRFTSFTLSF